MTTPSNQFDIGEVSRRSGLPVSTLHVWEKHNLIKSSRRNGLRRQYDPDILERIAAIVLYQRGGFSHAEIAELLHPDSFSDGKARFGRKLDELRHRQNELATAIAGLEHALSCPEPSPMDCSRFRSMLDDVLPVQRD